MKPLPLFAAGINTGTLIGITVINNTVNTVNQAIRNVSCLHLNPIHPGDQLWATHLQLGCPKEDHEVPGSLGSPGSVRLRDLCGWKSLQGPH